MKDDRACHTHFVFSRQEYDTLCTKAKKCGLSRSAYLRRLIMDQPVKARPPEAIRDLYVEINRIGVNINQIAHNANAGLTHPDSAAAQALFLLGQIHNRLREVTRE